MQAQNTIFADSVVMVPKVWTEEDLERLSTEPFDGAPDLAVEVISPIDI